MIEYSQYFTKDTFADLLIGLLPETNVVDVLDMGIGDGALTHSARRRWPYAHYVAIDIDENICASIRNLKLDNLEIKNMDAVVYASKHRYSVAICNPPYGKIDKTNLLYQDILTHCIKTIGCVPTMEVLFIYKNLQLLRNNGVLGVVVPDGVLTRQDLQSFRQWLLMNFSIENIIALPSKVFDATEASTHIMIIRKSKPKASVISVGIADVKGEILDTLCINSIDAIYRMDYKYHKWKNGIKTNVQNEINDNVIYIKRGKYSHAQLKQLRLPYIHSNSFEAFSQICLPNNEHYDTQHMARKGDILICRVGRRCVGKVAYVKSGWALVSDCVYIVRVSGVSGKKIFNILKQQDYAEWLAANAHGVCAKVISKNELKTFVTTNISATHFH